MQVNSRKRKSFLVGAWGIAITLLLIASIKIITFIYFSKADSISGTNRPFFTVWLTIWSIVLLTEIIIYIKIRKLIYRKLWVWIHVLLTNLALFVIPISAGLIAAFSYDVNEDVRNAVFWLYRNLIYFIFTFLIVGHLFFALTLFKSFQLKKSARKNDEIAGLLDEFVK